ncbi:MAG: cytochrome c3 family protein [Fimbriimonadales bacterium]
MPNLFRKSANNMVKITFLLGGLGLASVLLVGANVTPYTHRLGVALDQPAPFSHKHHVKELGISCYYCHDGVEKGPIAGVPVTETCYTCHSQIWTNSPLLQVVRDSYEKNIPIEWTRVNDVPDFVYFDHSIHIAKGVSCYTCHGDMDEQNLSFKENAFEMRWCLNCHRNPDDWVRPDDKILDTDYQDGDKSHAELGAELVKKRGIRKEQLDNCSVCHR